MYQVPNPIQKLINEFSKLPGVGEKSATRMAYHYLKNSKEELLNFSKVILQISNSINRCRFCMNFCEDEICTICSDNKRNKAQILVVEEPLTIISFENTGEYNGLYHILGGLISPVNGIGPTDLFMSELVERVKMITSEENNLEIILAITPNLEGEATSNYIKGLFTQNTKVKIERIARGIPTGANLEYADKSTLQQALSDRKQF